MTDKATIHSIPVPKLYTSSEHGRPKLLSDLSRHQRKRISKTWRRATASDIMFFHMYAKPELLPEAAKNWITTLKMLDLI